MSEAKIRRSGSLLRSATLHYHLVMDSVGGGATWMGSGNELFKREISTRLFEKIDLSKYALTPSEVYMLSASFPLLSTILSFPFLSFPFLFHLPFLFSLSIFHFMPFGATPFNTFHCNMVRLTWSQKPRTISLVCWKRRQ